MQIQPDEKIIYKSRSLIPKAFILSFVLGLIAGAIVITGCGDFPGLPASHLTFKVKGLYLGMDIEDVPAILTQMSQSLTIPTIVERDGEDVQLRSPRTPEEPISHMGACVIVSPDSEGKVRQIVFIEVDALFNCADMGTSEFVEQFMKAYNIPEMKRGVFTGGWVERLCWTYNGDGIEVKVLESEGGLPKCIIIDKVPTAQERSFD